MNIRKSILLRVRISLLLVALFGGAVVYQLLRLQYAQGAEWQALGQAIGYRFRAIPATRGNIFAADGSLLATSLPFYQLAIDPSVIDDVAIKEELEGLCKNLSAFFRDKTPQAYHRRILRARREGRQYVPLGNRKIGYQEKKRMENWPVFHLGQMKGGVIFEKVERRFQPFGHLGQRTVGRVNEENKGTVGLEHSFNKQLAGLNGQALFQKMVGGGWKPVYDGSELRPQDGYDVYTTLDVNLQDISTNVLRNALESHEADYGVAIVMEVATGEIRAMVNLSRGQDGRYQEAYNYAVGSQGAREPGSTFKLASMIALLEETELQLSDSVQTGNGEMKFFDQVMHDHSIGGFGTLSVQEVFEKSSNIGVAKLVTEHFGRKPAKFIDYFRKMGLTEPLDFQIVGEGRPYIKDPSDSSWSGVSLPWISHGYELKLTPLHMLTLYNAVANDGKMMKPQLVSAIRAKDQTVKTFGHQVLNEQICAGKTLQQVQQMLRGVVERGTARNISGGKFNISGKTGTAKRFQNGRYTNAYYTSFAGYFPSEAPKYSCIVVIDHPKGFRIYGSDVAAPVFKDIADRVYALERDLHQPKALKRGIPKDFPLIQSGHRSELKLVCDQLGVSNHSRGQAQWVQTEVVNQAVIWTPNDAGAQEVPDVQGMTLRDALYLLENRGLEVSVTGRGRVKHQSLPPGTRAANKHIELTLSEWPF